MKTLLVLTIAVAAVPGTTEAAFPGSNGRIAFSDPPCFGGSVCEAPGANETFVSTIGPNGGGRRTFPCSDPTPFDLGDGTSVDICSDSSPAWSPDGELVAIATQDGIWVTAPNGSAPRQLVATSGFFDAGTPAFTRDGRRIAYSADGGIKIVPLTGGPPELLLPNASSPAFSATGRLTFERNGAVWVAAADGSGARRLREGSSPDWAPGGKRIIFSCRRGICRMTPKGRLLQHVRGTKELADNPTYSPDGTLIAFDYNPSFAKLAVYTVKSLHGRRARRLAIGQAPSWRPLP